MSTTKDNEKISTGSKPQPPAPSGKKKSELPDQIPGFPGDGGSGSTTTPTGK